MTLGRKVGLLAAAFLLPPTIAISVFTVVAGASQIRDLTQRNLELELNRFRQACAEEFASLRALSLEGTDFYRQNAQRKLMAWARTQGPRDGFLYIRTSQGQRILPPSLPLGKTLFAETDFAPWSWVLGVAVSRDSLESFGRQTLWNTLWIDLIFLLPLALAGFLLSRSISGPVARLQSAAEALSRGNFSVRAPPMGSQEIQSLALAFNGMADHIQSLTGSLEKRVKVRTEELEHSLHEMARKERLASLGALVAGVAHEINTPLGICVTSASTLQNGAQHLEELYRAGKMAQEDFEAYLETLKEGLRLLELNLGRSHELVASFKRLSVDQSAHQKRVFSPLEYLQDVVASLAHELKIAGAKVELTGGEGLRLRGDPGLLSQIALNWVMNSLLHGFEDRRGGEIRMTIDQQIEGWRLEYSDNGQGMDAPTLERLYEPFFTTKPGTGGGLGMSLVYSIVVERLGGAIQAYSHPGEGVRYSVYLPYQADGYEREGS